MIWRWMFLKVIWRWMFFEGDLVLDVFAWWETIAAASSSRCCAMQEPILTDGRLLYLPDRNLLLSYLLITAGHD